MEFGYSQSIRGGVSTFFVLVGTDLSKLTKKTARVKLF